MTHFYDYVHRNGRTLITDSDGNTEDFCEEIRITAVLTNIRSKAQRVRVSITLTSRETVCVNIERDRIASFPIPALAKYGLTLASTPENNAMVTEILFDTQVSAHQVYFHDVLGWGIHQQKRCFFGYEMLGATASSTYLKPKKLCPKGTFVQWREGIIPFLAERPELQLALAIGACAPIAALLQKEEVLDLISVFALIGRSSTGKTTALKAMSGIWGRGSIKDGIIDTLLDTQNRFFANLGKKNGFPCFIDETSLYEESFTSALYQLSMGRERGRCNPDGSPKKTNHWLGAIIFTGETSLFSQTNGNSGLFARLVEFPFMWTKDSPSAEALTQHCAQYYGTAYIPLIEYLMSVSIGELIAAYHDAMNTLRGNLQAYTGVEHRLMKQYALLLLTARIIQKVWAIPVDEESVVKLLLYTHAEHPMHAMPEFIFNNLKEQIIANLEKFPKKNSGSCDSFGLWGERDIHNCSPCVWIAENRFSIFLGNAHAKCCAELLMQFHSNGWLVKFGDRYKKDHLLGGTKIKCYCLIMNIPSVPILNQAPKVNHSQRTKLLGNGSGITASTAQPADKYRKKVTQNG